MFVRQLNAVFRRPRLSRFLDTDSTGFYSHVSSFDLPSLKFPAISETLENPPKCRHNRQARSGVRAMETSRRRTRMEGGPAADDGEANVEAETHSETYEESRKRRIEENKQRLEKLGILDLSKKLKSELLPPKLNSPQKKPQSRSPASPLLMRSSSRLMSKPSVNYCEMREKKRSVGKPRDVVIRIKEGVKPEIYTEEDQKRLGEYGSVWSLGVDGYENGKRVYDQVKGKSCHQCRQKTLGRHTNCSKCGSGLGMLCGDCLYMRYGENVIEANENPNWTCPVCRDICNCSFCRQAKGWAPTGNLYRKVTKLGFKSVAHYLIQTRSQGNAEEQAVAALNSMNASETIEIAPIGYSALENLETCHSEESSSS